MLVRTSFPSMLLSILACSVFTWTLRLCSVLLTTITRSCWLSWFHLDLKVAGLETSRNPGSQQGSWFHASLTGKTFENQEPWMALRDSGAALSVLSERVPVARLKGGVRGLSPIPSLTAGVDDPEGRHTSPRMSLTQGRR